MMHCNIAMLVKVEVILTFFKGRVFQIFTSHCPMEWPVAMHGYLN